MHFSSQDPRYDRLEVRPPASAGGKQTAGPGHAGMQPPAKAATRSDDLLSTAVPTWSAADIVDLPRRSVTPLGDLAAQGDVKGIEDMLDSGANPLLTSATPKAAAAIMQLPAVIALQAGHQEAAEVLLRASPRSRPAMACAVAENLRTTQRPGFCVTPALLLCLVGDAHINALLFPPHPSKPARDNLTAAELCIEVRRADLLTALLNATPYPQRHWMLEEVKVHTGLGSYLVRPCAVVRAAHGHAPGCLAAMLHAADALPSEVSRVAEANASPEILRLLELHETLCAARRASRVKNGAKEATAALDAAQRRFDAFAARHP